jgi:hypothetical protein
MEDDFDARFMFRIIAYALSPLRIQALAEMALLTYPKLI